MLKVNQLMASVEGTSLLHGVDLEVKPGEIHAIMGPNGAGKSTFAKVLAGHPAYEVTGGEMCLLDQDISELEPEERALCGLFVSFQYPVEVAGVTNLQFLQAAYNAQRKGLGEEVPDSAAFEALLDEKMRLMEIRPEFKGRNLNEGFSGGEKKRNEILQMALLNPRLAILDETDSGLDIDALRVVAAGVRQLFHPEMGLVLITHYQRLLDLIQPDHVHVMVEGKIALSGGAELAKKLEERGYDWI